MEGRETNRRCRDVKERAESRKKWDAEDERKMRGVKSHQHRLILCYEMHYLNSDNPGPKQQ